jgi:hypothetical protein
MVEWLKVKTLSSSPSTTKKKKEVALGRDPGALSTEYQKGEDTGTHTGISKERVDFSGGVWEV